MSDIANLTKQPGSALAALERRTIPKQKRARERIHQIYEATSHLLATINPNDVTTTAIAKQAGIPVSSIYRYFPNVYAIYREMFETMHTDLDDEVVRIIHDDEQFTSWRQKHAAVIAMVQNAMATRPAYAPLFVLTRTAPDLASVKTESDARLADLYASRWKQGMDGFSGGNPEVVATTAAEIFTALQVKAILAARHDKALAESYFYQAQIAVERYLSVYLGDT